MNRGKLWIAVALLLGLAAPAWAENGGAASAEMLEKLSAASSDLRIGIDTVWVLVAAMLVFFMNAGFGLVESGLCRAKNTTNILWARTSARRAGSF